MKSAARAFLIRLLLMLLFAFAYSLAEMLVVAVVAVQLLARVITNRSIERLRALGAQLGTYLAQIVWYVTFASEHRPFPWSDWPSVGTDQKAWDKVDEAGWESFPASDPPGY